jgi:hypothetical protein
MAQSLQPKNGLVLRKRYTARIPLFARCYRLRRQGPYTLRKKLRLAPKNLSRPHTT